MLSQLVFMRGFHFTSESSGTQREFISLLKSPTQNMAVTGLGLGPSESVALVPATGSHAAPGLTRQKTKAGPMSSIAQDTLSLLCQDVLQ